MISFALGAVKPRLLAQLFVQSYYCFRKYVISGVLAILTDGSVFHIFLLERAETDPSIRVKWHFTRACDNVYEDHKTVVENVVSILLNHGPSKCSAA